LLDDTVFGHTQTYDYYLQLYRSVQGLARKRYWIGQANLDAAASGQGRRVIRAAADAGLVYTMVGIESLHAAQLARSGALGKTGLREATSVRAHLQQCCRVLQQCGILVSGWFVLSPHGDLSQQCKEIFDFCRRCAIVPVVFPVQYLPGTRLYAQHPDFDQQRFNAQVRTLVQPRYRRAMRLSVAIKRSALLLPRFGSDHIHRFFFALMTQRKMRRGIIDGYRA
jgi:hypothetical protein